MSEVIEFISLVALLGFIHSPVASHLTHRSRRRPPDVRKVADDFLSADHVRVVVGAKRLEAAGPEANRRVAQTVVVCEQRARDGKLIELLRKRYPQGGSSSHYARSRLIVFGLYKKVDAVSTTAPSSRD